jgi:diaminohydroxyphosphoribosylaminopyrimidine deaminase/5-amino-6-(5-phosphoribosylamino)uracil reductase
MAVDDTDLSHMRRAVALGAGARAISPPNPWVGCVIVAADGRTFEGATQAVGGPHAEAVALAAAGSAARGATAYVTLEPCSHQGRTPPCVDALVEAGVTRVVVGLVDPDRRVAGRGLDRLRAAGVELDMDVAAEEVAEQLAPYLHHRRTGRPWVVLKAAVTADGRTAAPDGTSQWITGDAARTDAHRLRAESDAILVGAGTVRADDPSLTVRLAEAPRGDPLRVVLGTAPPKARVRPCLEWQGELPALLDDLGRRDVVQLLVEGGATVAAAFHRADLVDRYVLYVAPALFGGDDAPGMFRGSGADTMAARWRGRFVSVVPLGGDLRVELAPASDGGQ